jgi:UDP-N-acetylglucosamine 2-epimerase (non-hydrolysing)
MSPPLHVLVGTRAQLIKMAPVIREIERRRLPLNLLFTGQHQLTMQELLDDFGIGTPHRLVYRGREIGGLVQMGGWFCLCLWRLLRHAGTWFGPRATRGVLVVHGDTMSTLLGALAGRLLGMKVAHVESGLRSFRLLHPFPEELTRLCVFRLADYGYCPGAWAAGNLRGHRAEPVDVGENTLVDAVRWALGRAPSPAGGEPYYVASIHRFENLVTRGRLLAIVAILERLATRARCVFVLHPVTAAKLRATGLLESLRADPRFDFRERMPYTQFIALLSRAAFVITDGGSNQEELSYLAIPTVLMRAATERREGLGDNVLLSGYDAGAIDEFLDTQAARARPERAPLPAANPSAAIVDHLVGLSTRA